MKVAGIDPASAFLGFARVRDGALLGTKAWKPANKSDSGPERLLEMEEWLHFQFALFKPDITVVEKLAVFQNAKTIRVLSHYEGVALLTAKKHSRVVLNVQVSSGRKIVFGDGGMSKDKAWEAIKKMYPDTDFGPKQQGGLDRADAAVCALAGEGFAERLR